METLLLLPLLGLLLLLLLVYKYGTRTHGTLEKLGIPVIKPYPFFGSYLRPWTKHSDEEDLRNARRFGGLWGQYDGMTPTVYIGNVELAKRVLIKDFDYFQDRPNIMDFEYGREILDFLKGERWKLVRSVFSKTIVSGSKLKAMMSTIRDCTEDAFRRLDTKLLKCNELVIRDDLFGPLVLDVMSQFSFGIKVPNVDDPMNPFVKRANIFVSGDEEPSAWQSIVMTISPANGFKSFVQPSFKFFSNLLRKSIKERRTSGVRHNDIVDVMIDAIDSKVPTKEFRDLDITEHIIVMQGAELLMASYSTTATVLSFCTYYLAQHPDITARVIQEVEGEDELTYETVVQRLPLLEAVLRETMRLTPSLPRHIRECTRDWEHDGLRIPAGMNVVVTAMPIHQDSTEFPEPERFLPDRWLGEDGRKLGQYHWMPFGHGPRACIGSRLATLEIKYVMASLLKRYRVSPCERTRLQMKRGLSVLSDFHFTWVKVEKR